MRPDRFYLYKKVTDITFRCWNQPRTYLLLATGSCGDIYCGILQKKRQEEMRIDQFQSNWLLLAMLASSFFVSCSQGFVSSDTNMIRSKPKLLASLIRDEYQESRRSLLTSVLSISLLSILPSPTFAADNNGAGSKALSEEYRQGTAALADMDEQAPVPREAYKKLASGVIYADLRPGSGEEVKNGSRVNLQWVLRKSNGYFVDSSAVSGSVPFIFAVGDGTAIQGVDEGVRGMKAGGVRRLLIPPSLAYVEGLEDGKPGPLPVGFGPRQQMRRVMNVRKDVPGEYVFLEVQATRVR